MDTHKAIMFIIALKPVILPKTHFKRFVFVKPLHKSMNITVAHHKDCIKHHRHYTHFHLGCDPVKQTKSTEHVSYTAAALFTLLNLIQWRIRTDNSPRQSRLG